MILAYIVLLAVCLWGMRLCADNPEYCSKEETNEIKGVFVPLVFFGHIINYKVWGVGLADSLYVRVDGVIGQLVVVMFLFYSGYGVERSLLAKKSYARSLLRKRLLPVWLRFAVCVGLFLLLQSALGNLGEYSASHVLLAFTGWTSIGNSNWFMFDTFALYLLVWCSFALVGAEGRAKRNLSLFSVLSLGLAAALFFLKQPYWWNTVLTFPLGMWFGLYKERIDAFLRRGKHRWRYASAAVLAALLIVRYSLVRHGHAAWFELEAMLFAMFVVLISMKIRIGNPILGFFGRHVFSIYMLQRLPMILFRNRVENQYLYFCVCFAATLILAVVFDAVMDALMKQRKLPAIGSTAS